MVNGGAYNICYSLRNPVNTVCVLRRFLLIFKNAQILTSKKQILNYLETPINFQVIGFCLNFPTNI